MFNICVFKCDWVDSTNDVKVHELGFTLVDLSKIGHKSDPFIFSTQAKQVFYVENQVDPRWSIALSRPKMEDFNIEGDDNMTIVVWSITHLKMGCLILTLLMKLKIVMNFVCILIVRGLGLKIKYIRHALFFLCFCDY